MNVTSGMVVAHASRPEDFLLERGGGGGGGKVKKSKKSSPQQMQSNDDSGSPFNEGFQRYGGADEGRPFSAEPEYNSDNLVNLNRIGSSPQLPLHTYNSSGAQRLQSQSVGKDGAMMQNWTTSKKLKPIHDAAKRTAVAQNIAAAGRSKVAEAMKIQQLEVTIAAKTRAISQLARDKTAMAHQNQATEKKLEQAQLISGELRERLKTVAKDNTIAQKTIRTHEQVRAKHRASHSPSLPDTD
jgi:hypothetical protein